MQSALTRHRQINPRALGLIGWVLIAIGSAWWITSLAANQLQFAAYTWVPACPDLGLDFSHNYLAVNLWLRGGNPYQQDFGDSRGLYAYPPIVLPLHLWCFSTVFSLRAAAAIWALCIAGIALATAAWIKIYPVVLLASLIAVARYRAAACACLASLAIACIPGTQHWFACASQTQISRAGIITNALKWIVDPAGNYVRLPHNPGFHFEHGITSFWYNSWLWDAVLPQLKVPGFIVATAVTLPFIIAFCWITHRSRHRSQLILPLLLLLAAAATFWMPVSYDYNLIYLPILTVCLWRPDASPSFRWLLLIFAILAFSPIRFESLSPGLMFTAKLMTLAGCAVLFYRHANQPMSRHPDIA